MELYQNADGSITVPAGPAALHGRQRQDRSANVTIQLLAFIEMRWERPMTAPMVSWDSSIPVGSIILVQVSLPVPRPSASVRPGSSSSFSLGFFNCRLGLLGHFRAVVDHVRRDEHDHLVVRLDHVVVLEQPADQRQIAQQRDLLLDLAVSWKRMPPSIRVSLSSTIIFVVLSICVGRAGR